MAQAVAIKGVSKTFPARHGGPGIEVLKDIELDVDGGEFVAIIGPSGCGKSTLLSLVAGYLSADTGSILVNSQPITGPGPDRMMVFQHRTLFPWQTTLENVVFGLSLGANRERFPTRKRQEEAAREFIELVGLTDFKDQYPHELSGGMQQRVEIARALAVRPQVLLMDEPFGALDALTRRSMQNELARIHAKTHCTTLFITHDVYEAIVLANRVVVMTHRPAQLREVIHIDIEGEARRDSVRAIEIARHISSLLDKEITN